MVARAAMTASLPISVASRNSSADRSRALGMNRGAPDAAPGAPANLPHAEPGAPPIALLAGETPGHRLAGGTRVCLREVGERDVLRQQRHGLGRVAGAGGRL